MTETIATLEQRLRDTFDRRFKAIEETQKEHHKTLFGNGVPGWDEMIRAMYADYLKRQAAEEEERKREKESDKQTKRETLITKLKGSMELRIAVIVVFTQGLLSVLLALFDFLLHR